MGAIPHPMPLSKYQMTHSVNLRFTANTAVAQSITFQNLLDTVLVATTAVAGANLFYMVRVRKVEVWAILAIGTATSCSVIFDGTTAGLIGDRDIHVDTSMGVEPAHVVARPTARTLAGNFQINSAASAFRIDCPGGSVIDVHLSFVGNFGAVAAAANALVAANAGATYLRGLDGLAIATSKMLPAVPVAFTI